MSTVDDAIVDLFFDGVPVPDLARRELAARLRRVLARHAEEIASLRTELHAWKAGCGCARRLGVDCTRET